MITLKNQNPKLQITMKFIDEPRFWVDGEKVSEEEFTKTANAVGLFEITQIAKTDGEKNLVRQMYALYGCSTAHMAMSNKGQDEIASVLKRSGFEEANSNIEIRAFHNRNIPVFASRDVWNEVFRLANIYWSQQGQETASGMAKAISLNNH